MPQTRTRPTTRTEVTVKTDHAASIVPPWLDYPAELEEVTEDVRAGIMREHAARAAVDEARRAHEQSTNADRFAAALSPDAIPAKTEPELREQFKAAAAALEAATDSLILAKRRQDRAITRPVASKWRKQHQPQVLEKNAEIRAKLAEVGDLIAVRDQMLALDAALERAERGEHYRLDVPAPGWAARQVQRETERHVDLLVEGHRPVTVANEVPHLLAALAADAERWRITQENKRHHERYNQIVLVVREMRLPGAQRDAEILRRLDAEGVRRPNGIIG